jgi:hypothetical protein
MCPRPSREGCRRIPRSRLEGRLDSYVFEVDVTHLVSRASPEVGRSLERDGASLRTAATMDGTPSEPGLASSGDDEHVGSQVFHA